MGLGVYKTDCYPIKAVGGNSGSAGWEKLWQLDSSFRGSVIKERLVLLPRPSLAAFTWGLNEVAA